MSVYTVLVVLSALISQIAPAQAPVPVEAYTLHAKEARQNGFSLMGQVALPGTVVLLDQAHNLLVLIPQADGEWILKRLSGWDTGSPTEDSLEIKGEPGKGTRVSVSTDLHLSRDGRYLLVRINYVNGAIEATERNRSAVVTVVEMKSFAALSKQVTTDPLLADSEWAFDEHDNLVTTGLERRLTNVEPSLRTVTNHYVAATLEVPSLDVREKC